MRFNNDFDDLGGTPMDWTGLLHIITIMTIYYQPYDLRNLYSSTMGVSTKMAIPQ